MRSPWALVGLAAVNVFGVRLRGRRRRRAHAGEAAGSCGHHRARAAAGHAIAGEGAAAVAAPASGLAAAMIGVLWSYGGWQHASFAAGEAKRPARDVPIAMIAGTAMVTLVYLLANVAYLRLLPLDVVAASPQVASEAVRTAVGSTGGSLVAGAVAVSALGSAGIYTLTTPRVYWAMAERGLFFRGVAGLHPRWKTPVRAIVLQTSWAIVLVLAWGTFEGLVSYVVFVDWISSGWRARPCSCCGAGGRARRVSRAGLPAGAADVRGGEHLVRRMHAARSAEPGARGGPVARPRRARLLRVEAPAPGELLTGGARRAAALNHADGHGRIDLRDGPASPAARSRHEGARDPVSAGAAGHDRRLPHARRALVGHHGRALPAASRARRAAAARGRAPRVAAATPVAVDPASLRAAAGVSAARVRAAVAARRRRRGHPGPQLQRQLGAGRRRPCRGRRSIASRPTSC